ncbi:toprim domain-containing protein [Ralstonia sp. ASV6]|uniref:toprim domain-containing protein n=1 Tax=Ralstonia sp. ASV6 TaxID=2795124 RepID=UPI0018EC7722|nr:toprim domain-containing protein [Ralstonia sp. ASV6]
MEAMNAHLAERWLNPSRYRGVFVAEDSATFALWNFSGQMVGYQTYRPDRPKNHDGDPREGRYFTFVSRYGGRTPELAVWGLETVDPGRPLFLCEGVFDACRLHALGLSCVATLGSDPKPLRQWLNCLPQLKVAVCDGDAAGRKLAKFADEAVFLPDGKDAGDLSENELRDALRSYL